MPTVFVRSDDVDVHLLSTRAASAVAAAVTVRGLGVGGHTLAVVRAMGRHWNLMRAGWVVMAALTKVVFQPLQG
jgi:hypothetical protein